MEIQSGGTLMAVLGYLACVAKHTKIRDKILVLWAKKLLEHIPTDLQPFWEGVGKHGEGTSQLKYRVKIQYGH